MIRMDRFPIRSKVLIVTEGYTEKNYLERLRERDSGFELIVRRCPEQRPNKILRFCVSCMNDLGISLKDRDSAYCVFDVDFTSELRLQKVLDEARKKGIGIILSKPCFEVFFLLHFTGNIDRLAIPQDAKDELGAYLNGYSETGEYWEMLKPHQDTAIERSREYQLPLAIDLKRMRNGTNIYEIFDDIAQRKKDGGP